MRENRQSGSEGGARFYPLSLPQSKSRRAGKWFDLGDVFLRFTSEATNFSLITSLGGSETPVEDVRQTGVMFFQCCKRCLSRGRPRREPRTHHKITHPQSV